MNGTENKTRTRAAAGTLPASRMDFGGGKLQPQAIDLEEAVLGAMMLEKNALSTVIDILKPESFYKEAHQKIFAAIMALFNSSQPIDILTVTNQLKKTAELDFVGGPYYISQLTNRIASTANIEFHARIVSQKHIQRELIRVSSEIIEDAFKDTTDVFDLLDKAESNLFTVGDANIRKNYQDMTSLITVAIKQIEGAMNQKDGVSGVPSGFTALDRVTSGWQKQDMVILAARPGMGKTAFVLSLCRNAAVDHKKPVAIFSLEMSSVQLVNRLIAAETGLDSEKLKKGQLRDDEWQQLITRVTSISDAPIYIDDTPALSVFEFRAKCRRLKAQHNVELIVVDYLQLMTAGGEGKGNREQEISIISRSIKSIAKELDVPIIALSQLSRAVETRGGDKRPMLSDLRESGAIEQDADMVMFIYRPEYYGLTEDKENGSSLAGLAQIIIAKHRNGQLGDVNLKFIGNLLKFTDYYTSEFDAPLPGLAPNESFDGSPPAVTFSSKLNNDDPAPF